MFPSFFWVQSVQRAAKPWLTGWVISEIAVRFPLGWPTASVLLWVLCQISAFTFTFMFKSLHGYTRRISQSNASRRLRPVAVSARLTPSHASYRGPELVWATGRLMSPDRGFGTSCLLHGGHLTVSPSSEDSWRRICLPRTRLRRLVTYF